MKTNNKTSCDVELSLCHTLDDTIECVVIDSSKLQPPINQIHASVATCTMFGWNYFEVNEYGDGVTWLAAGNKLNFNANCRPN